MDTTWLLDFLALAECANFSRAAERRHMTQPAFSRRIRLLEDWVGAALVNRDTHQITLTPAGDRFRPVADEVLRRLHLGREEAKEAAQATAATVRFASTHALSLTFFPTWLRSLETETTLAAVSLVADHMEACEQLMQQGEANFLLCHHHPAVAIKLNALTFRSLILGQDVLLPVSAPDARGGPLHALPGQPDRMVPLLAYSATSGIGRILAAYRAVDGQPAWLDPVFTSHVATVLKTMARSGRGVTWSPLSLVSDDLAQGFLVRAGDKSWDIPIEIRLFRPRSRQSRAAEAFWTLVTEHTPGQSSNGMK
jgi:LysR family transcriptional regulator, hypochlorite-specific transcription factor HypT